MTSGRILLLFICANKSVPFHRHPLFVTGQTSKTAADTAEWVHGGRKHPHVEIWHCNCGGCGGHWTLSIFPTKHQLCVASIDVRWVDLMQSNPTFGEHLINISWIHETRRKTAASQRSLSRCTTESFAALLPTYLQNAISYTPRWHVVGTEPNHVCIWCGSCAPEPTLSAVGDSKKYNSTLLQS